MNTACPLCRPRDEQLLWRDDRLRVIAAQEPGYPGFCRVIWSEHVAEMTDLSPPDRVHCMEVVFRVEATLRELLMPRKINLAALGNFVPHLHWHVIPRFADDPTYPDAVWAAPRRTGRARRPERLAERLAAALARGPAA